MPILADGKLNEIGEPILADRACGQPYAAPSGTNLYLSSRLSTSSLTLFLSSLKPFLRPATIAYFSFSLAEDCSPPQF